MYVYFFDDFFLKYKFLIIYCDLKQYKIDVLNYNIIKNLYFINNKIKIFQWGFMLMYVVIICKKLVFIYGEVNFEMLFFESVCNIFVYCKCY